MADKHYESAVALSWSHRPYHPILEDRGAIYITRLVPERFRIQIFWMQEDADEVRVRWRPRDAKEWNTSERFTDGTAVLSDLKENCEYQFYLEDAAGRRSLVRLARTGDYLGVPINYLHPEDTFYAYSGRYLCSPSIVRQPDGSLLASMDLFEGNAPQNLTLVYRSDDNGKTWEWQCELFPCFWGKLFVFRGKVYMLGCSTEHGDILLGRTEDGGKSFGTPTVLVRGPGRSTVSGPDMSPEPPVEFDGRIWFNFHWGSWQTGLHNPCVASAPVDADLLNPESWTVSAPCVYDENWPGAAKGKSTGTLEGTFAVLPDHRLYILARYGIQNCVPDYGLAILYRVQTENPSAPLQFERTIPFPGNHSKFTVLQDEKTGWYYSIVSRIRGSAQKNDRNLLSLMKSRDCINWTNALDIFDLTDLDPKQNGLQYVDFFIEGDSIYYACRAGINGSNSFHNSNVIFFRTIDNFRTL